MTAPNGKSLTAKLPQGGFGISRFLLDSSLAQLAQNRGVTILQNTKVDDVKFEEQFSNYFSGQMIKATVCCAAYGKRSNLDVKKDRPFVRHQDERLNNYVGIKYHVKTDWKPNVIGLHNFQNGYCGISKIEDEKFCLCYMTKAQNLKSSGGNIHEMQEMILSQNPYLKNIFASAEVLHNFPMTISQISFSKKSKVQEGMLMLGDAAGMITPLCGNGMSIALHTSKIAATLVDQFLQQKISRQQMENAYEKQWQQNFESRLKAGRILQSFFGSNSLSNALVSTFKLFPFLTKPLIKLTHGKPF